MGDLMVLLVLLRHSYDALVKACHRRMQGMKKLL